ncbi:ral guanine nucleotide dissociation stimulator-like [Paramacrobiotus metropolitanus]|uniref:ral guanine nucleotide dissociation stimulator-like n=1 Tax=Paramacrobiotus metropolitanus TaxID=2943436 RepID=UPI0024458994|nr:ral guanine nucleotide dissociation stimulator-like [Paramacrobiotus metropolitanus]
MQVASNLSVAARKPPEQHADNRRYWMDEEEEDAVYSVFLKKVRYAQSNGASLTSDDNIHGSVSYMEWQTIKVRLLKAGTMERIMQALINSEYELESSHVNIFLDTYREFTTPEVVVEYLLRNLSAAYGTPLERPTKQLLVMLFDNHPEDFPEADADPAVIAVQEHAEKFGDLDLKTRINQWIVKQERSALPNEEVLEWIRETLLPVSDVPVCPASPSDSPPAEDLLNYSDKLIAGQLTLVDAVLLRRLLPHQCLAQERARNASRRSMDSVQATICHFNAICARVQSSLLGDLAMTASLRLRLLIKWIDIAHCLLVMRNFSSLNAVISALQAEPVFRLEKLWASLPVEKLQRFRELTGIFTVRNELQPGVASAHVPAAITRNYMTVTRDPTVCGKPSAKNIGHRRSYSDNPGNVHGVVPYLGKFLTDLVMLDTALPDYVSHRSGSQQRLINFDKRRKEFEILAHIRWFQSAAASYQIAPHDHFRFWFYKSLRVLDSEECFSNSFLIEAPAPVSRSTSEVSSASEGSQPKSRSMLMNGLSTLKRMVSQENLLNAPFLVTRKNSISSSQSLDYRRATSAGSAPEKSPYVSDTFCILKISLDAGSGGGSVFYGGVNLYKSVLVNDNEKTLAVIRQALDKQDRQQDEPASYDLVQVLSRGEEFVIPADATVFYAINSAESDLRFILRRKIVTLPPKFAHATLPKSSSMTRSSKATRNNFKKWSIKTITRC